MKAYWAVDAAINMALASASFKPRSFIPEERDAITVRQKTGGSLKDTGRSGEQILYFTVTRTLTPLSSSR
jgi:hypothetical protein